MGEGRQVLLFGVDLNAKIDAPEREMAGVNSPSHEVPMEADAPAPIDGPSLTGINSPSHEVPMGVDTPAFVPGQSPSMSLLANAFGELMPYIERNLLSQTIIVAPGQDIIVQLLAMSRRGSCALQIFSALGMVSHVKMLLANHSGSFVTEFQGMFPVMAFEGTILPSGDVQDIAIKISNHPQPIEGSVVGELVAGTRVEVHVGSYSI